MAFSCHFVKVFCMTKTAISLSTPFFELYSQVGQNMTFMFFLFLIFLASLGSPTGLEQEDKVSRI